MKKIKATFSATLRIFELAWAHPIFFLRKSLHSGFGTMLVFFSALYFILYLIPAYVSILIDGFTLSNLVSLIVYSFVCYGSFSCTIAFGYTEWLKNVTKDIAEASTRLRKLHKKIRKNEDESHRVVKRAERGELGPLDDELVNRLNSEFLSLEASLSELTEVFEQQTLELQTYGKSPIGD